MPRIRRRLTDHAIERARLWKLTHRGEPNLFELFPHETLVEVLKFVDFRDIKALVQAYPFLKGHTVIITAWDKTLPDHFDIHGITRLHYYPRCFAREECLQDHNILLVLCDLTEELYETETHDESTERWYRNAIKPFTRVIFDRILRDHKTRAVFVQSTVYSHRNYTAAYIEKKKELIFSGVSFIERMEYPYSRGAFYKASNSACVGIEPLSKISGYGVPKLKYVKVIFPRLTSGKSPRPSFTGLRFTSLRELFIGYHSVIPEIHGIIVIGMSDGQFSLVDLDAEQWNSGVVNPDIVPYSLLLNQKLMEKKITHFDLTFTTGLTSIQVVGPHMGEVLGQMDLEFVKTLNIKETEEQVEPKWTQLSTPYLESFHFHSRVQCTEPPLVKAIRLKTMYYLTTRAYKHYTNSIMYCTPMALERYVIHSRPTIRVPLIDGKRVNTVAANLKFLSVYGALAPFLVDERVYLPALEHISVAVPGGFASFNEDYEREDVFIRALKRSSVLKSAHFELLKGHTWRSFELEFTPVRRCLQLSVRGFKDDLVIGTKQLKRLCEGRVVDYYTIHKDPHIEMWTFF